MIRNPEEENIKLSPEQLKQIETAQLRLANIQNETIIATKLLNETKSYCLTASNEKKYQEEMLSDLNKKFEEKKLEFEKLMTDIEFSKVTLDFNTKKSQEIISSHEKKSYELKDKEDLLNEKIKNHSSDIENFNIKTKELFEEKLIVENAKNILQKAIESITWK